MCGLGRPSLDKLHTFCLFNTSSFKTEIKEKQRKLWSMNKHKTLGEILRAAEINDVTALTHNTSAGSTTNAGFGLSVGFKQSSVVTKSLSNSNSRKGSFQDTGSP